jgi:hypothetical protein
MMFSLPIEAQFHQRKQRIRQLYIKPLARTAPEHIWHLEAGHLRSEAIAHIITSIKNVHISKNTFGQSVYKTYSLRKTTVRRSAAF